MQQNGPYANSSERRGESVHFNPAPQSAGGPTIIWRRSPIFQPMVHGQKLEQNSHRNRSADEKFAPKMAGADPRKRILAQKCARRLRRSRSRNKFSGIGPGK